MFPRKPHKEFDYYSLAKKIIKCLQDKLLSSMHCQTVVVETKAAMFFCPDIYCQIVNQSEIIYKLGSILKDILAHSLNDLSFVIKEDESKELAQTIANLYFLYMNQLAEKSQNTVISVIPRENARGMSFINVYITLPPELREINALYQNIFYMDSPAKQVLKKFTESIAWQQAETQGLAAFSPFPSAITALIIQYSQPLDAKLVTRNLKMAQTTLPMDTFREIINSYQSSSIFSRFNAIRSLSMKNLCKLAGGDKPFVKRIEIENAIRQDSSERLRLFNSPIAQDNKPTNGTDRVIQNLKKNFL